MWMSSYLADYPFANRLYPGALDVLERLRAWGPTVILSDGDVVFQPRKVQRSGIWEAVHGHVLIYIHKEEMLDEVARRYPAQHYVLVDDKPRILAAVKEAWGDRVTTIFPRQGQYARDAKAYRPADLTIERGPRICFARSGPGPAAWTAGCRWKYRRCSPTTPPALSPPPKPCTPGRDDRTSSSRSQAPRKGCRRSRRRSSRAYRST